MSAAGTGTPAQVAAHGTDAELAARDAGAVDQGDRHPVLVAGVSDGPAAVLLVATAGLVRDDDHAVVAVVDDPGAGCTLLVALDDDLEVDADVVATHDLPADPLAGGAVGCGRRRVGTGRRRRHD